MDKVIHKADSRGHFNHGWLNTYHTFSFANYYDPARIHFGNLRVINDDTVEARRGFGTHPHDNMEIITIVLDGELTHEDSMGHKQSIVPNEVQVMSAGTGIFHSEYNHGTEPVSLLQIWIFPQEKNIKPVYNQHKFEKANAENQWQFLVNGEKSPLKIHQNARISRVFLEKGKELTYQPLSDTFGNYFFLVEGNVSIDGTDLERRDGLGIKTNDPIKIIAETNSFLINFEV